MKFARLAIPEIVEIETQVFADERGFFLELWNCAEFRQYGIDVQFVQYNHSRSVLNTLRGLHYQIRRPQGKLIQVLTGQVFDVAVDIRLASPTFGKWVSTTLSSENKRALWIPPGFAHGFYVLTETADVMYACTELYAPEYDRAILWNDPELAIKWPIVHVDAPLLSEKDANANSFGFACEAFRAADTVEQSE